MWGKIASLFLGDGGIIGKVLDKVAVDADTRAKLQAAIVEQLLAQSAAFDMAAADIVKTEAASSGWLTRSWRPIVMLTFTGLIVARWFGWAAPALNQPHPL